MAHAHKPITTSSKSKRTGVFVRSFESTIMNESFAGNAGKENLEWLTKEKACLLLSEGTLSFFYKGL